MIRKSKRVEHVRLVTLVIAGVLALVARLSLAFGSEETVFEIRSEPAGAHVFVDGGEVGLTPLRLVGRVSPGRHVLRVELEGHRTFVRKVPIEGVFRLSMKLQPVHPEPLPQTGPKAAEPPTVPAEKPAADAPSSKKGPDPFLLLGALSFSGKTFEERPAAGIGGLGVSFEWRRFDWLGFQFGASIHRPFGSQVPDGVPGNAIVSQAGISAWTGLSLRIAHSGPHRVTLVPRVGALRYYFNYFAEDSSGELQKVSTVAVSQLRYGGGLAYYFLPPAPAGGTPVGFHMELGFQAHTADGGYTPKAAPFAGAGVVFSWD